MNRRTKLLAAVARAVAVALTLSVAVGPAAAQEVRDRASTAPSALRESIDRAASRALRLEADPKPGQASGGGGGTVKTIVAVLGIAASVWATWYTVQWMKKQQEKQAGFRP
jgi:hypothetical protein